MSFVLSEYSTTLTKKDFGPLFLLALLVLEGPKHISDLLRIMKCCDKTLRRQLAALGDLVILDRDGVIYQRTDLSTASPINNNHNTIVPSLSDDLPEEEGRGERNHEVREPGGAGTDLSDATPAEDELVRPELYRQLANRATPLVPAATAAEIERVIQRVDRWFVRPQHRQYLDRMVMAAAESTRVAAANGNIRGTGMQYFSGTLQNMAQVGRWQASRSVTRLVDDPEATSADGTPAATMETLSVDTFSEPQAGPVSANAAQSLADEIGFALGLRKVTVIHRRLIDKWVMEWGFAPGVVLKAVEQAALTGAAHLAYVDAILTDWLHRRVRTLDDVDRAMAEHRQRRKQGVPSRQSPAANRHSGESIPVAASKRRGRFDHFVDRQTG